MPFCLLALRNSSFAFSDTYVEAAKANAAGPQRELDFMVVSHSLGSFLMFSALDLPADAPDAKIADWKKDLDELLRQTSHAYFMANQIRLLELANLEKSDKGILLPHLKTWSDLRAQSHLTAKIIAFSDPSDWLTWEVPENKNVTVKNIPVKNAHHWFWYFERPDAAHLNYDRNKHVLRAMLENN